MDIHKGALLAFVVGVLILCGVFLPKDKSESANRPNVSAYITTVDGRVIPIPYARPHKAKYLVDQTTQLREVPKNSGMIEAGYQAVIPERMPIGSMHEGCLAEFGGLVTVMKARGETLLVKYAAPGNSAGMMCPSGEYAVSTSVMATMNERYLKRIDSFLKGKRLVQQLLEQDYHGQTRDAGDWRWVNVVNINPIKQNFSNGHRYLSYGDICGVGSVVFNSKHVVGGGIIEARSAPEDTEDGTVLYEYRIRKAKGLQCPSKILFFEAPLVRVVSAQ